MGQKWAQRHDIITSHRRLLERQRKDDISPVQSQNLATGQIVWRKIPDAWLPTGVTHNAFGLPVRFAMDADFLYLRGTFQVNLPPDTGAVWSRAPDQSVLVLASGTWATVADYFSDAPTGFPDETRVVFTTSPCVGPGATDLGVVLDGADGFSLTAVVRQDLGSDGFETAITVDGTAVPWYLAASRDD